MCWFEDSVVAEPPRPLSKPVARVPSPTPPLPASPPLEPATPQWKEKVVMSHRRYEMPLSSDGDMTRLDAEAKEIQNELVLEEKEIQTAEAEESNASQAVEEEESNLSQSCSANEEMTNLEHYPIHTEEGQNISFTSYVNSSGVRMIEINADAGIQIKLSTLEHCVKTMMDSASRVDDTEVLENERQQEFDACAEITVGVALVLFLILVVSIHMYLTSRNL